MRAEATTTAPADTGADTIAIGHFEGEPIPHDVEGGLLQALVDSGEAKPGLRKLAVTHAGGKRYVLAGLGTRAALAATAAIAARPTASETSWCADSASCSSPPSSSGLVLYAR